MNYAAVKRRFTQVDEALSFTATALSGAERPVISTKFGPESAALLHMVTSVSADIPVIWVDTGYNTRATVLFAERLGELLSLNLSVWHPDSSHVHREVPALEDPDHALFSEQVKLEPFRRALSAHRPDLWFSGLRREQTPHRSRLTMTHDSGKGYLKVHPLLDWTREDVLSYLDDYALPSEPDYYDPTKGEPRRECGLHLAF